jgi:hypothetical protein
MGVRHEEGEFYHPPSPSHTRLRELRTTSPSSDTTRTRMTQEKQSSSQQLSPCLKSSTFPRGSAGLGRSGADTRPFQRPRRDSGPFCNSCDLAIPSISLKSSSNSSEKSLGDCCCFSRLPWQIVERFNDRRGQKCVAGSDPKSGLEWRSRGRTLVHPRD